ncbi:MAG: hypothetical protein N2689_11735, partial [Verrucomicrobiae bacterium]|nr:hypothetical protein [Verrucomicrobiae bacterium]
MRPTTKDNAMTANPARAEPRPAIRLPWMLAGGFRWRKFLRPGFLSVFAIVAEALAETDVPRFSWQDAHATVLPTGDLEWSPKPFKFERGASVRYIDFEGGDDAKDGTSKETAWKHHPWDAAATGNAKACSGIHTYVFKGGVHYRGEMVVKDAGQPGNPIRLTRDPAWGNGEAVICGSEIVRGWTQGADHKDIPEPDKVWYADLDFAPRSVWMVRKGGDYLRIPLARVPNWKVSNPDDVKSEWWVWDNPRKPFGNTITNARGRVIHLGIDTKHIKDKTEDYFKGALIWPEFGWVMSCLLYTS